MRRSLQVLSILFLVSFCLVSATQVLSYKTGPRWVNKLALYYSIDSQLDTKLGVSGSSSKITSQMSKWNKASNLVFALGGSTPNIPFTASNFSVSEPCFGGVPSFEYAMACRVTVGGFDDEFVSAKIAFNTDSTLVDWNTSGSVNCTVTPKILDLSFVALHEMGHLFNLGHGDADTNAVMHWNVCVKKLTLTDDDLRGATQLYGPRTGWETDYAQGNINTIAYVQTSIGYGGSGSPELNPRSAEFSVPVKSGSKYEVIAGTSQSSYSYAYFKLFTRDNEEDPKLNYLKIQPGMKLVWDQYNYEQTTMSLDFITLDNINMRDSHCTDQYGSWTHPAFRDQESHTNVTGAWIHVEVSLDCLQGKIVKDWLIAYDSGSGASGVINQKFRAYFDNVKIIK